MKESIPENENLLNRESKKALLELKQKPDETSLYCLQLAEYSLQNSLDDPDGRLTTTLEEMKGWKPEEVMNYLEKAEQTSRRTQWTGIWSTTIRRNWRIKYCWQCDNLTITSSYRRGNQLNR